jgi:hypothetical protein
VTIQNQKNPRARIEKYRIPVVMSLILAAVALLIPVAATWIPAVVMSILAVVKHTLFFSKRAGIYPGPFFRSHLKKVFCPNFCVGTEFQLLEIL